MAVSARAKSRNEVLKGVGGLEADGIVPIVYQMHTVKPLDTSALDRLAQELEALIVVEEHVPSGGLWAAVCDWHVRHPAPPRLIRLGPPDAFALGNLKQSELRRRWGFDAAAVAEACRQAWRNRMRTMTNWRYAS